MAKLHGMSGLPGRHCHMHAARLRQQMSVQHVKEAQVSRQHQLPSAPAQGLGRSPAQPLCYAGATQPVPEHAPHQVSRHPCPLGPLQRLQHQLTLSTTMTSASMIVLSLWATMIMVRSWRLSAMASWILRSVRESRELVACTRRRHQVGPADKGPATASHDTEDCICPGPHSLPGHRTEGQSRPEVSHCCP